MTRKEDPRADWHPEIIKAEIRKRGLSFRALSIQAGSGQRRRAFYLC